MLSSSLAGSTSNHLCPANNFSKQNSRTLFHVLGLKCQHCGSYNTAGDDEQGEEEDGEQSEDRQQPEGEEAGTLDSQPQGQVGDGEEAASGGASVSRGQPSGGDIGLPPRGDPEGTEDKS